MSVLAGLMNIGGSGLAAAPAGLWTRLWFRDPAAAPAGASTDSLYIFLWWFCVAWFVFLMALMVYFCWAYRRRRGRIAPASASHNTPLEIIWTIVPTLCLVYIFFAGFTGYMDKMVAPGDAIEMKITAQKWQWEVEYPNGFNSRDMTRLGAKDIPVFYMPAERAVRLRLISTDVMHALWISDFRIKQDALPNRYMSVWFEAKMPDGSQTLGAAHGLKEGDALFGTPYSDHWLMCAEYCGTEHSEMAAVVRIIPEDKWTQWLGTIGTAGLSPADIGKFIHHRKCSSCHSVDGSPNTGPTWKNMWGYEHQYQDGSTHLMDENFARQSILVPGSHVRREFKNEMTPFQGLLKENELEGIFAFMKTLSDKGGAPAPGTGDAPPAPAPAPDQTKH